MSWLSVSPIVGAKASALDVRDEHLGIGPFGVGLEADLFGDAAGGFAHLDHGVLGKGAVLLEVHDVRAQWDVERRKRVDRFLDGRGEGAREPIGERCPGEACERRLSRQGCRRIEWHGVGSGKSQALWRPVLALGMATPAMAGELRVSYPRHTGRCSFPA